MRFYDHDGIETDVQDPKFFIDEVTIREIQESLTELLDERPPKDEFGLGL